MTNKQRDIIAEFEILTDSIDKKIGEFVNAHLVTDGAISPKNEIECQIYDKIASVGEILGLL